MWHGRLIALPRRKFSRCGAGVTSDLIAYDLVFSASARCIDCGEQRCVLERLRNIVDRAGSIHRSRIPA